MNADAKDKLAGLVREACERSGGQRAYSRKLGVSLIAVQGWVEGRSVPTLENLCLIAADSGFSLSELLSYLGLSSDPAPASSLQVLKQMRLLNRQDLAQVVAAGVKMLAAEGS